MKRIALALLFLLMASPATAGDKDGNFGRRGAMSHQCGNYITQIDRNSDLEFGYQTAFMAYLTAFNRYTPDVYDLLGGHKPHGAFLWLENYCRENPLHNLVPEALDALIFELWPHRLKEKP